MRVMGSTPLEGPLLHGFCYGVRYVRIQWRAMLDGCHHALVGILRQTLLHFFQRKGILTVHGFETAAAAGVLTAGAAVSRVAIAWTRVHRFS